MNFVNFKIWMRIFEIIFFAFNDSALGIDSKYKRNRFFRSLADGRSYISRQGEYFRCLRACIAYTIN